MQGVPILDPVRRGGLETGAQADGLGFMLSIPFRKLVFKHAQRRVLRAWRIEEKGKKQPLKKSPRIVFPGAVIP